MTIAPVRQPQRATLIAELERAFFRLSAILGDLQLPVAVRYRIWLVRNEIQRALPTTEPEPLLGPE